MEEVTRRAHEHVCLYPGIPQECLTVLERCVTNKLIDIMPDQLTVNQYESGQGEILQPRLWMTYRITYSLYDN